MPGSGRVGGFKIPPVNGKFGISTSNHEPVDGISGHESTDFTPEFLPVLSCAQFRISFVGRPSLHDRGLSQIWRQHRQLAHLLLLHGTTQVGGMIPVSYSHLTLPTN